MKNIMLTLYLTTLIKPVAIELPSNTTELTTITSNLDYNGEYWLRVKSPVVQLASPNVKGILYEPTDMTEN